MIAVAATAAATGISLDDLMAESLTEKAASDSARAARNVLSRGGMSTAEKEAITAGLRAWEAKREWLPAAAVVMFTRQQCQCCMETTTQYVGAFQRQVHRHSKADRWIASALPQAGDRKLPREAKYQDSHTELCENCAEALGFDVEES